MARLAGLKQIGVSNSKGGTYTVVEAYLARHGAPVTFEIDHDLLRDTDPAKHAEFLDAIEGIQDLVEDLFNRLLESSDWKGIEHGAHSG